METEFNFDSACTSPFMTAPSSPSFFCREKHQGIQQTTHHFDDNFEFDFGLQRLSISHADDLFSSGIIKPLIPSTTGSPRSPRSPRNILIEGLSPKCTKRDSDPFEEAQKRSTRNAEGKEKRSPLRIFDILSDNEHSSGKSKLKAEKNSLLSLSFARKYKKVKEFFLFRSASEGRKDDIFQAKSYLCSRKDFKEDVKNSSFRSTDSSGSASGSSMRRKGFVSAHEVHYTVNRAAQEEMKKKTALPYKHGLMLGCLGLEPPVHDLARSCGPSRA